MFPIALNVNRDTLRFACHLNQQMHNGSLSKFLWSEHRLSDKIGSKLVLTYTHFKNCSKFQLFYKKYIRLKYLQHITDQKQGRTKS